MSISSYNKFNLVSKYEPTGDQPQAIQQLVDGVNSDVPAQTLMGVNVYHGKRDKSGESPYPCFIA